MYVLHQDTTLIGASEELLEINAMLDNPLSKDALSEAIAFGANVLLFEVITAAEAQGFTLSSLTNLNSDDRDYGVKLLKDATSADIARWHKGRGEIAIIWSVEDVELQADEDGYDITKESAMDLLLSIESNHDCCYGITWDTISDQLGRFADERSEGDEDE